MKIEAMIRELDTVTGMLIVDARQKPIIKEAMEKVMKVSIELGELAVRIDNLDTDENLFE